MNRKSDLVFFALFILSFGNAALAQKTEDVVRHAYVTELAPDGAVSHPALTIADHACAQQVFNLMKADLTGHLAIQSGFRYTVEVVNPSTQRVDSMVGNALVTKDHFFVSVICPNTNADVASWAETINDALNKAVDDSEDTYASPADLEGQVQFSIQLDDDKNLQFLVDGEVTESCALESKLSAVNTLRAAKNYFFDPENDCYSAKLVEWKKNLLATFSARRSLG